MSPLDPASTNRAAYHLRFCSLRQAGRGFSFPCDRAGSVEIDGLSDRARDNYFFARAAVGREFFSPEIVPVGA